MSHLYVRQKKNDVRRFFSPKCRVKVTGKKKNVVINGILEAYLKAFPHKRPQPRIDDESEKTNKTLYPVG